MSAARTAQRVEISRTRNGGLQMARLSDKPSALSGITKRVNLINKASYLARMWEAELPERLLWHLCTPLSPAASASPSVQRRTYRALTWSWGSIERTTCHNSRGSHRLFRSCPPHRNSLHTYPIRSYRGSVGWLRKDHISTGTNLGDANRRRSRLEGK